MSSLVSDFIINPVLRQARRFSEISRATFVGDGDDAPENLESPPEQHDAAVTESSPVQSPLVEIRPALSPPVTRLLSEDAQVTSIEEIVPLDMMPEGSPPQGITLSPLPSRRIPEDDGMRVLRTRIQSINARDIPSTDKARLMHELLLEGYRASIITSNHVRSDSPSSDSVSLPLAQSPLRSPKFWQNLSETPSQEKFILSEEDITPTYVPIKQPKDQSYEAIALPPEPHPEEEQVKQLGCQHYARNVKMQCSTCQKWYTCRFCHDAHEDHNLIRNETKYMLCMICTTPQEASDVCINCGEVAAAYYCNICKLWENRQDKPVYHCADCGICRRGRGLGKDFFHCKTCRACISISIESSHRCIERSTDCDCPICGEYMFTSPRPVVFMACGHSIHKKCYHQHMKVSYKCPICNKSLMNMESQFRNLDVAIQTQPMPAEFSDTTAVILCNDCSGRSTVRYHWLGLKCSICRSYNTVELQMLGPDQRQVQPTITEAGEPILAAVETQPTEAGVPIPVPSTSMPTGRRRHSSHGIESQFRAPEDRVARSFAARNLPLGIEAILGMLTPDGEPDDDILGIWRARDEEGDSAADYESDEASDEGSDAEEDDDDEDEEDDDIVLIGHR